MLYIYTHTVTHIFVYFGMSKILIPGSILDFRIVMQDLFSFSWFPKQKLILIIFPFKVLKSVFARFLVYSIFPEKKNT